MPGDKQPKPALNDRDISSASPERAAHKEPIGASHRQSQQIVADQIGRKETRRLRAKADQHRRVWFGLGMFGLVGWSVAIPTLLGTAAGLWLDRKWEGRQSWTLMLMLGGLVLGCMNAWRWLRDESEMK